MDTKSMLHINRASTDNEKAARAAHINNIKSR